MMIRVSMPPSAISSSCASSRRQTARGTCRLEHPSSHSCRRCHATLSRTRLPVPAAMPVGAVDRRIVPLAPGFLSLVVVLGLARRQRNSTQPRSPSRRCSPRRPAIPRWNRDEPPRTLRVAEPRRVPAMRRRVALSSRSVATVCFLVLSDYSGATGTVYILE